MASDSWHLGTKIVLTGLSGVSKDILTGPSSDNRKCEWLGNGYNLDL